MTKIVCPCCGGKGEIDKYPPVPLTPIQIKIYEAVRASKYGIDSKALVEKVYGDRHDGGPVTADDCLRVTIYHANARLKPAGMRIKGTTRGKGSVYKMVTA